MRVELLLFGIVGLLLHWATLYNSARRKPTYEWNIFVSRNWLAMVVELIATFICIYDTSIVEFIGFDVDTPTKAVVLGFNASVFWNVIRKLKRTI